MNVIVGSLARIDQNCIDQKARILSTLELFGELRTLNYPRKAMISAIAARYNSTFETGWDEIRQIFVGSQ